MELKNLEGLQFFMQNIYVADGFEMEINEPPIGFEIDRKECVAKLI